MKSKAPFTHNFPKKIKKWREANKRKNLNRRNSK